MTVTWEHYLARPEVSEFVDGEVIVNPPPTPLHQLISSRLDRLLWGVDADLRVAVGWLVRERPRTMRIPDLVIVPNGAIARDDLFFAGIPLLAVEILSTDRHVDVSSKAAEYAAAGLPRYWIVDPRDGVLEAMRSRDGDWHLEARLDAEHPEGALETGAGVVHVDLGQLFA